jgi:hypothetical protein
MTAIADSAHRIRHYGLFANGSRAENIARARELLNVPTPQQQTSALYEKLNFNLLTDIVPVASFMRVPNVMEVRTTLPFGEPPTRRPAALCLD